MRNEDICNVDNAHKFVVPICTTMPGFCQILERYHLHYSGWPKGQGPVI